ncbi:unnamed protein product [Miscanthus lutarioriparius]|uniref:Uncharacterized protein n=1 Tax=Miscanthus lutarioriparius TaxID=422564 RepID=A0A811QXI7_9POAL|nr:unnamed protein product [Miscanthus lutarioriparius]
MAPVGPKGAPSTQRLRREQTQAYFLALGNFMFAAASMQMQFPGCAPPDPTRILVDLICILLDGSCGIECFLSITMDYVTFKFGLNSSRRCAGCFFPKSIYIFFNFIIYATVVYVLRTRSKSSVSMLQPKGSTRRPSQVPK